MAKIFIVENDINIALSLEALFGLDNFQVQTFADGETNEIIEKIILFKPEYLIANLILPKANGFELIEKIKINNELADLPLFVFSKFNSPASRLKSLQLGADYHFAHEDCMVADFVEKFKKIIINRERKQYLC